MNTLSYKGYIGSIEVNEEDDCLYGKVLFLPHTTLITYEGETVAELRADFQSGIDSYLEHCKEHGIEPCKSYNGVLNVRLSPDSHYKVAMLAKRMGESINAFIKDAVEKQIAALL